MTMTPDLPPLPNPEPTKDEALAAALERLLAFSRHGLSDVEKAAAEEQALVDYRAEFGRRANL